MEMSVFDRIRGSIMETRQNLSDWLRVAPPHNREVRLGPAAEPAIKAHFVVLDTAIAKTKDHTLGICEVCHGYVEPELLEMDYTACVCLDHFSGEERRLLEADLELAFFSRPAQIVGGDYFDFFHFGDGSPGLAIADVAGHGMSSSLLMASVQTALRTLVPTTDSPADVLRHLNRFFCHNIHLTTFVTLFLARFDPAQRMLTYGNAGHNPPLLYRHRAKSGDPCVWLQPTGAAIGLIEAYQISTQTVELAPGDILLLYTDGVTEAINAAEDQFGQDRLAALVRQGADLSAKEVVQRLRQGLQEFTNGQPLADDTTILVAKMNGQHQATQ